MTQKTKEKCFWWCHWIYKFKWWCSDVPFVDLDKDSQKKVKIISDPNRIRLASNRILKKYQKQRQKGSLKKKTNKKANKWQKKVSFLGTDDLLTINCNNDVSLDDSETVDFNNDTQMADFDKIDLKKTSATQQVAKKLSKNIKI